jgi:glycosyltransferase involved in cell wall biosynthesis
VDGIEVLSVASVDLSRLSGGQVSFAPRLAGAALRLVESFRPDVLHANGLFFQTTIAAAVCRRLRGIPLVTTAHIGSPDRLPGWMRAATLAYEGTVGRYVLTRSARVIAVAASVADHLLGLGVPADRIEVIANGVDLARFAPGNRIRSDRHGTASEPPLLLFVGRLIENKGPGLFLDALVHLRSEGIAFRAAFVGDGPQRLDLSSRVAGAGLSERVTFAGHSTDVAGWLARATVLVRPSLTEGMPLTVLEAMASGVLVIASDIPGNTGLIHHLRNGLVFPSGDARALAGMLRFAADNPAAASALAEAGHQSVRSFSWDACAEATLGVLARVAPPAGA